MAKSYVEYALSFGVSQFEGLWRIQYLHPFDASLKMEAWVPYEDDSLVGKEFDGITVADPGPRLRKAMTWFHNRITRYPYYWPKEGSFVDKFGYDFEVELSDKKTTTIELTQVAFDILSMELDIQPESTEPNTEIDIEKEQVAGGGVLVKLSITLEYAQPISELNLAPFTKYPMKIESLLYEEDTESYHPKKEILLGARQTETSMNSVHIQFPVVTAKRLTLILRQANAEKNSYAANPTGLAKSQLWNQVSQREAALAEALTSKDEGWALYLNQIRKYQTEVRQWKQDFEQYKAKEAERLKELDEATRFATVDSTYREEYNQAVIKYKTRIVEMENTAADYERAYAQYERELSIYNQYIGN